MPMKHRYLVIYSFFSLVLLWLLLTGNSSGAMQEQGIDRTGSPFSPATCQECHLANAFNPSVQIALLDDGEPVTEYIPGESYTMQVTVHAAPQAARFGFQTVALAGADNHQAGTFQNAPFGIAIRTKEGRQYPEQSFKSLSGTFALPWVAPPSESGAVRFYAAGVAANNDSSSSGDGAASTMLEIQESSMSSTLPANQSGRMDLRTESGGISATLPLRFGLFQVFDLAGRQIAEISVSGVEIFIPLPYLTPAVYVARWADGNEVISRKFYFGGR